MSRIEIPWVELRSNKMRDKNRFLSYREARQFVHSLNIKSQVEWRKYCKNGKKPHNIPSAPNFVYKNKGWVGYSDWLGTEFLSYKEARQFVRSLHIKSAEEWRKYSKSGKKPHNIPSNPNLTYKNEGWVGYSDWLGTGFLSYKEARKFVRSLHIKSYKEWIKYCKSRKRPSNIPSNPNTTYKNKGWVSFYHWLGK